MFRPGTHSMNRYNEEVDLKGAVSISDSIVTSQFEQSPPNMEIIENKDITLIEDKPTLIVRPKKNIKLLKNPVFDKAFDEWAYRSSNRKDYKAIKDIIEAKKSHQSIPRLRDSSLTKTF